VSARRGIVERLLAAIRPEPRIVRVRVGGSPAWAERAYSGAAIDRTTAGMSTVSALGPNAEVSGAGTYLRDRTSALVRNNPHAKKAIRVLVGDLVGTGCLPKPVTGNADVDKRLAATWSRWSWQSAPNSRMGIHGQVAQAVRGAAERGNSFLVKAWRPFWFGYAIPLQFQLLESDFLDTGVDTSLGRGTSGPVTVQGVEFDQWNRRAGYWFHPSHPGESGFAWGDSIRVDARDVIHVHEELGERPSQALGVPWLHAIIRTLYQLGEFDHATQLRQMFAACPIGVATGGDPDDEGFGPSIDEETGERLASGDVSDAWGNVVEKFEPAMTLYAHRGKSFEFSNPPMPTGIREFHSETLHSAAAGADLTYEALSGDLSGMSWTSYRAGRIPYNRWIRMGQALWLVPCVYQPIWDAFVDGCSLSGIVTPAEVAALGPALYNARWTPPRLESVDPAKDAAADLIEVLAGFASRDEKIAARGRDPEELDAEIKAERDRAAGLGLTFNSDAAAKLAAAAAAPQPTDRPDEEPDGEAPADEGTEGRSVRAVGER
jgi:lambda family phage portal protein